MRFILAAVLIQWTRTAEIKAVQVAADGSAEALLPRVAAPGYVRREHRSQDSSLAQLVPQPVNQVVEDARQTVSNLKSDGTVGIWKEEERQATTAMALSLLASLSFVLTVFYMWNTPALEAATRKVLVSSISLFSVVLLFMVMKKLWKLLAGSESSDSKILSDGLSFLRFLLLFLLPSLPALQRRLEKQMGTDRMRAFQITGVHIIGFAGADAFSDLLKLNVFCASAHAYLLGVCCMVVLLGLINWVSAKLRTKTQAGAEATSLTGESATTEASAPGDPEAEPPEGAAAAAGQTASGACQLVERMEVEIAGFVVGFLVSMWVRFTVTGAVPGAKFGRQITGDDVSWLFCFCLAALLFTTALAYLPPEAAGLPPSRTMYFLRRCRRTLSESVLMSFAWLVFYLFQWMLWHITADGPNGAHHTAKLTASNALALVSSVVVFLPMVGAKLLGKTDRLLSDSEPFVKFAALVLGFSWETAVYMVVQGTSESTEGETMKKLLGIATILLILIFILPGWYLHMLPEPKAAAEKASAEEEEKEPS